MEKSRGRRQQRLTRYNGAQRGVERVIMAAFIVVPLPVGMAIGMFVFLALLSNGFFYGLHAVCSDAAQNH